MDAEASPVGAGDAELVFHDSPVEELTASPPWR